METKRDVFFHNGQPDGNCKRILAKLQWRDEGQPYFDILYWYPTRGLKYPSGWYDQSGENVPDSVIVRYAEF